MPDVYVAIEADTTMAYYNRLANSGQLFQFAFDYADQHRPELMAYGSVDNFRKQFKFTDAIYRDLQAFAAEKGVKGSKTEQRIARDRTAILFKAYLGRNLFDDPGFYPIYQEIDEVLQKALETFDTKTAVY